MSPFAETAPVAGPSAAVRTAAPRRGNSLPAGWRRLATGLRGARLYKIAPVVGGVYWFVEVMRDGAKLSRRFASELHARAWLLDLLRPVRSVSSFDWEELNRPLRTSAICRH